MIALTCLPSDDHDRSGIELEKAGKHENVIIAENLQQLESTGPKPLQCSKRVEWPNKMAVFALLRYTSSRHTFDETEGRR